MEYIPLNTSLHSLSHLSKCNSIHELTESENHTLILYHPICLKILSITSTDNILDYHMAPSPALAPLQSIINSSARVIPKYTSHVIALFRTLPRLPISHRRRAKESPSLPSTANLPCQLINSSLVHSALATLVSSLIPRHIRALSQCLCTCCPSPWSSRLPWAFFRVSIKQDHLRKTFLNPVLKLETSFLQFPHHSISALLFFIDLLSYNILNNLLSPSLLRMEAVWKGVFLILLKTAVPSII